MRTVISILLILVTITSFTAAYKIYHLENEKIFFNKHGIYSKRCVENLKILSLKLRKYNKKYPLKISTICSNYNFCKNAPISARSYINFKNIYPEKGCKYLLVESSSGEIIVICCKHGSISNKK